MDSLGNVMEIKKAKWIHCRSLMLKNLGVGAVGLVLAFSVACGGDNDSSATTSVNGSTSEQPTTRVLSSAPTNTPTPYPTPTPLPQEDQIREGAQTFVTVHCEA